MRKLRYRAGAGVYLTGAPAALEAELALAPELHRSEQLGENLDIVQAFFTRKRELQRELIRLRKVTGEGSILWLCYPKAGGLETDLDREVVRGVAAKAGLCAVGIVAIDAVWSALRFKRGVARVEMRGDARSARPRSVPPRRRNSR
jgi:hypothetical protein